MGKKALYYFWHENPCEDCIAGLKNIGFDVERYDRNMVNYTRDDAFLEDFSKRLSNGHYDLVFSFDYFPLLSMGAQHAGIPYYSWVYDSPHLTLFSETLGNPCNRVFLFDYALYDELSREGFSGVRYLPLPCNVRRFDKLLAGERGYLHDISFVGSLYDGEDNFYRQIRYLPEELRGYLEALIGAQKQVYGMNLISELLVGEKLEIFKKYVDVGLGTGYRDARGSILQNILFKEITARERLEMLEKLGSELSVKGYQLALYSGHTVKGLPVKYRGYAENRRQMPRIFRRSKLNLNSTLRSIQTGIPMRVIEIMGAGGFCLTNYQAELEGYFENGKDLVWYESADDMLDKAEYYLTHDSERESIALNGRARIMESFTYETLLRKMMDDSVTV